MDSDGLLHLLAKKLGTAASHEELLELQELIKQYPEHQFLLEILHAIEGEKIHIEPAMSENDIINEGWGMLEGELQKQNSPDTKKKEPAIIRVSHRRSLTIAAAWFAVIFLTGMLSFFFFNKKDRKKS